jgi:hypothetical protein
MPMRPSFRQIYPSAPEKVVLKLFAARRFEGVHFAGLRIDARHDVLDDAVLARSVHALQHDQHGPASVRIEALLHFREPADAFREDELRLVAVGLEAERFGGIVSGEPEPARPIDPARFYDLRKLHCRLTDVRAHNQWTHSSLQV